MTNTFRNPEWTGTGITNTLNSVLGNLECNVSVLIEMFDADVIDEAELMDRINSCRKDLMEIEQSIPELIKEGENTEGAN